MYDDWVLGPFRKIANRWETAKDRPLLPSLQSMRTLIVMTNDGNLRRGLGFTSYVAGQVYVQREELWPIKLSLG